MYRFVTCVLRLSNERAIAWEFPLEYHYAVFVSMFAITLTYSVVFPPMLPLGCMYAVCKTFGDRYALLFAHEGNLDAHFCSAEDGGVRLGSAGRSLNNTLHNCMLVSISIFQLAMMGFLTDKKADVGASLLLSGFCLTFASYLYRICKSSHSKVDKANKPGSSSKNLPGGGGAGGSRLTRGASAQGAAAGVEGIGAPLVVGCGGGGGGGGGENATPPFSEPPPATKEEAAELTAARLARWREQHGGNSYYNLAASDRELRQSVAKRYRATRDSESSVLSQ